MPRREFTEFQTNSVPRAKIYSPICSYAPMISAEKAHQDHLPVSEIINTLFGPIATMKQIRILH
jgi:tubulin alpha